MAKSVQSKVTFFRRNSPSKIKLSGFWVRAQGEVLVGVLKKFVPNDKNPKHVRPFYIVEVSGVDASTAIISVEGENGETSTRAAVAGDMVGVSANYALSSVINNVEDIGKTLKMAINGEAENPNGGQPMILIDVDDVAVS